MSAGWTRVQDSLPSVPGPEIWDWSTESEPVLVFTDKGETYIATLRLINDDERPVEDCRDWLLTGMDGWTVDFDKVTHWHRLPSPPDAVERMRAAMPTVLPVSLDSPDPDPDPDAEPLPQSFHARRDNPYNAED